MVPYIPVRAKIFHLLPDLVENLRSLIASQYAEDVEISFFVSVIKSIGSPSLTGTRPSYNPGGRDWQRVRHAVFLLACEGVAAWHAAINIY